MVFWILIFCYWIHLLATVVWLGSLAMFVLLVAPAVRQQTLLFNQWLAWQQKLVLWVNGSLVLLTLTGFFQMTNDPHYTGFLQLDGLWAWGMLLKHLFFVPLVGSTFYWQFVLLPDMQRVTLLLEKKPAAASELTPLQEREKQLLTLNVVCAVLILLCTAVVTAV